MEEKTPTLLVDEKGAMALMGVSRSTLRRLSGTGVLCPLHIRGCVRYSRRSLEEYIETLEASQAGKSR